MKRVQPITRMPIRKLPKVGSAVLIPMDRGSRGFGMIFISIVESVIAHL